MYKNHYLSVTQKAEQIRQNPTEQSGGVRSGFMSRKSKEPEQNFFTGLADAMSAMDEEIEIPQTPEFNVPDIPSINGFEDVRDRVGKVESNNNYQARGPEVKSGMYAGQSALGKYQVMPGNLESWTRELFGFEMTPEEFLKNEDAQEAIFKHQMTKNYKRYGSWEDAVSVWFTGRPVSASSLSASDGYNTGEQYLGKVFGKRSYG